MSNAKPHQTAQHVPHPGETAAKPGPSGSTVSRPGKTAGSPKAGGAELPEQREVRQTMNVRETANVRGTANAGETPGDPEDRKIEPSWLEMLEMLPVIAQSLPHVTSLFQTVQPPPVLPTHSPVRQPDEILRKLVERAEFAGLSAPTEIGNLEIALDRGIYGISGVGMAVKQDSVAIVLLGLQHPANEQLAAAGSVLVRELQKHFPNRQIRVLAKEEEEERKDTAIVSLDLEAPVLAAGQREFTDGGRQ